MSQINIRISQNENEAAFQLCPKENNNNNDHYNDIWLE